ncbi:MAG TPA: hypothetical protein VKD28_16155 [Gemmatimonadales bacterium]|nr:hypothetical protein [Gemmatimonadales bacterium]
MTTTQTPAISGSPLRPPATLAVLRKLFDRIHQAGIRYCHWKSNQHLDASMIGATDLDLLVDRRDAARLAEILAHAGVKPFRKIAGDEYPGVEDYLAFDAERGALSHLHVHYQLTLGEKFLKGYRLPWERQALATRRFDPEHSLYVMDPHLELLLLVTRAALKLRARDWVLAAIGRPYVSGGLRVEFGWLVARIDVASLREVSIPLVGNAATERLVEIASTAVPSMGQLRGFREVVEPRLDWYRMYGTVDGLRRRFIRESRWVWTAVMNWRRGLKTRSTRVSPTGGLSVCIIGPQPDATNLARQLCAWLSTDMAVVPELGAASSTDARRSRGRGKIIIADRVHDTNPLPVDLAILLGDVPFPNGSEHPFRHTAQLVKLSPTDTPERLLNAKCALWESI